MRYAGFFKFRDRVCGELFRPVRFDAITCTDTCRKRLQRGGAFAYLADLSPKERRAERKRHALRDQTITSTRKAMAERRDRLRLAPNRPLRARFPLSFNRIRVPSDALPGKTRRRSLVTWPA